MNNVQLKFVKYLILVLFTGAFLYSCKDNEDLDTQTYKKRYVFNEVNEKVYYTVDPNTFCVGFMSLPDSVHFNDSIVQQRKALLNKYNLVYMDTIMLESVATWYPNFDTANTVVAKTRTKLNYEEAEQLSFRLSVEPTIRYANPFLIADKESIPNALTYTFFVRMQTSTTMQDLNVLLANTKTTLVAQNIVDGTHLIGVTKESKKDALDMSNEFFQTRLFKFCQPHFLKIKEPEK